MHIGSHYKLSEFLVWTRREIYFLCIYASLPVLIYQFLGWKWLAIPWVPIALVGTAAAFIVGFKNTQTYNRLWEARQIWGGIVNSSRAWGLLVRDTISADSVVQRELIYRHIAWLAALRYQLREPKAWENIRKSYNAEYSRFYTISERVNKLEDELRRLLPEAEQAYILGKKNRATQLIAQQSRRLKELAAQGQIEDLRYVALNKVLGDLLDHQGRSERIKNFPYPRQFASINLFFIRLFVLLVPFGMLQEFQKLGEHLIWLTIPFSVVVSWVFISMEKVGESTENPFEGGSNDVPITSMSRTIEIDLREMLDETDLPPAIQAENNILS